MAEAYLVTKVLTAFKMLDLLEYFIRHCDAQVFKSHAGLVRCRLEQSGSEIGYFLAVPNPSKAGKSHSHVWKQFAECANERQQPLVQYHRLPNEFTALNQDFLLGALIHRDPFDYDQKLRIEPPRQRELLLVLPDAGPDEVKRLVADFAITRTPVRYALDESTPDKTTAFFHLKWEKSHRSDPQSKLDALPGRRCIKLAAYVQRSLRLFMPAGATLHGDKIARYLAVAPYVGVLPAPATVDRDTPYIAAYTDGEATRHFHGNLSALRWRGVAELEPPRHQHYRLVVHDLSNTTDHVEQKGKPETQGRLRKKLGVLAEDQGYRLQLTRAPHLVGDKELERLHQKRDEIDYQIQYYETMSKPRPVLRRFSQHQLLDLARCLRSFPLHILREGRIRYGFTANERDPAGMHFLFYTIDEAFPKDLAYLMPSSSSDPRPSHFQLDPVWARNYFGKDHDAWNASHLVFVPKDQMMYPPMYGWSDQDMSSYLEQVLKHWFGNDADQLHQIKRPLYLFEHNTDPSTSQDMDISVLDLEQLQPFHERLAFFNDNLRLLTHSEDVAEFIEQMSSSLIRRKIITQVEAETRTAELAFADTAARINRETAKAFDQLLQVFTEEAAAMANEVIEMTAFFHQQDAHLRELSQLKRSIEVLGAQLVASDDKLSTDYESLKLRLKNIEEAVNQYLDQSLTPAKQRLKTKIENHVDGLNRLRKDISNKIREFLRFEL